MTAEFNQHTTDSVKTNTAYSTEVIFLKGCDTGFVRHVIALDLANNSQCIQILFCWVWYVKSPWKVLQHLYIVSTKLNVTLVLYIIIHCTVRYCFSLVCQGCCEIIAPRVEDMRIKEREWEGGACLSFLQSLTTPAVRPWTACNRLHTSVVSLVSWLTLSFFLSRERCVQAFEGWSLVWSYWCTFYLQFYMNASFKTQSWSSIIST